MNERIYSMLSAMDKDGHDFDTMRDAVVYYSEGVTRGEANDIVAAFYNGVRPQAHIVTVVELGPYQIMAQAFNATNARIDTPHAYIANTAYHPASAPCKVCSQSQYGNAAHQRTAR